MLRYAEEILLLVLDEGRGELAPGMPERSLSLALAGAVLMDLALENRIDTDSERLMLVDATPLGEDILDSTLAEIAGAEQEHERATGSNGRPDGETRSAKPRSRAWPIVAL